jgi:hypothetical protein
MLRSNLVDQNVIAHRPSPVRFDPRIEHFTDWDLMMQLTDDCDPMPLPAVAAYYTSDLGGRLSAEFSDPAFVADTMDAIRQRTIARRSQQ